MYAPTRASPVPPPDIGEALKAASPSNPTRPLDQRSIATWATWSRLEVRGGVVDGTKTRRTSTLSVVDQPAVQAELVGHAEVSQHQPEVADVALPRPEDHRPQPG